MKTIGTFTLCVAALSSVACGSRTAPKSDDLTKTSQALGTSAAVWEELGPKPIRDGFAHGVGPNGDANSGATNTVLPHPSDPNLIYVVPTTGGVWRTKNGMDASPHWEPLTDALPSASIGALAMDPGNPQVLVAGTGTYTLFGDPVNGRIYVTTTGGDAWLPPIEDPALTGKSILNVNVRGKRILVGTDGQGLYRSETSDVGKPSFSAVNGIPGNAVIRSLVADPSSPSRLFTAIPNTRWDNANTGIYRSDDDGANWKLLPTQAGGPPGNAEFLRVTQNPNIDTEKLAIGSDGRLYLTVAMYIDVSWVGRSDDHGETWTAIEIPKFPWASPIDIASIGSMTIDGKNVVVVTSTVNFDSDHPLQHAVRLAGISNGNLNGDFLSKPVKDASGHDLPNVFMLADMLTEDPILSTGQSASGGTWQPWYSTQNCGQWDKSALGVDPTDSSALYISGDCQQVRWTPKTNVLPNQIPSNQWTSIREGGTLSGTYPHPDSLGLAFDLSGRLLLGCDGGVFRHSNPKGLGGLGDWASLNTDLGTTQIHNVAIDPLSGMSFGGLQDNGTVTQEPGAGTAWHTIGGSDGNDTAVCARPGQNSDRYSYVLDVQTFNASGVQVGDTRKPALCVTRKSDGSCQTALRAVDSGQFIERIAINKAALAKDPDHVRLVIAGNTAVWESLNGGEDVTSLANAGSAINLAYGHPKNLDALWVISNGALFLRLNAGDPLAPVPTPVSLNGAFDEDVVMAPDDPRHAFVAMQEHVFATLDAGANWSDITGDLSHQSCGTKDGARARRIYAIRYVPSTRGDRLFIGTDYGVFMSAVDNPGVWTQVGSNLPHMAVSDMDYQAPGPNGSGDTLVAAIYGRGVWRITNASQLNRAPTLASFPDHGSNGFCQKTLTVPADATCGATLTPSDFGSGAIDPDGDPVTLSADGSGTYPLGSSCTTLSASDNSGASAACRVTIVVKDMTPPLFTQPPADITAAACGALTLPQPQVSDACGIQSLTNNAPASFPLGTTTVTWTATDTSGNPATAIQKVTVGGPPIFTQKPTDKTYTVCDTPPGIGTAKAVDVCGTPVPVTNNAPATFPIGTTTVTWTAKDSAGNIATFSQKVTKSGATDLGAEHQISSVKNNACLQITKYPAWGQYLHSLVIQPQATGVGWPIPFTYTNCGTNNGSGSLPGPWQQGTTKPVSAACPTLIKLGASGAGSVTLTWWGNG